MLKTTHEEFVKEAIARQKDRPGALLPLLHDIQDGLGYVPENALPEIAKALKLSRAEVHGVVSFYHHFRSTPPGKQVIRICRAEACQAMGAEALLSQIEARLKIKAGQTTPDGRFTLEAVYCLGNCACSPALLIDNDLHGRVDAARFDELVR
jgi:formate dehydrogenase subunit gamma